MRVRLKMAQRSPTRRLTAAVAVIATAASSFVPARALVSDQENAGTHYCKRVDAYVIGNCRELNLPHTPLGRQLKWVLSELDDDSDTVTVDEIRAHFSPAFLKVVMPPEALISAFRQTLAERGPLSFTGFSYPPRAGEGLPLVTITSGDPSGERGAIPMRVDDRGFIDILQVSLAPPTIVSRGRYSGLFDIGDRELFLNCLGHGRPTVVFQGGGTVDWFDLQKRLSRVTRVCSFDRPNGPWSRSEHAPTPRTARDINADLHDALEAADVPEPYVLAGHSNGGLFSLLYASDYRREVGGLVLIDAVHPEYYRRRLRLLKKLLPRDTWLALKRDAGKIPPELFDPERLDIVASQAQTRRSLHDSPLRRMPLFVLTHGRLDPYFYPPEWPADAEERLWRVLQNELANLLPNSRHVVARRSGHDIQLDQPDLVIRAIRNVVQAARTS